MRKVVFNFVKFANKTRIVYTAVLDAINQNTICVTITRFNQNVWHVAFYWLFGKFMIIKI